MATREEVAELNAAFFEAVSDGGTAGMMKRARDAVNDFTRTKMREDGFFRRVLPAIPIADNELTPSLSDESPYKIVEKEPESPAAVSRPFNAQPPAVYIKGSRYAVSFSRQMTHRFIKDVDELRSYVMDIRQVLSDNSLKDLMAFEDSILISTVNGIMLGPDVPSVWNGNVPQWRTISGGITRESWNDSRKIMPQGPSRLQPQMALLNHVTILEFEKWGRDEMGGNYAEDILKNGWASTTLSNIELVITNKRELVPDDTIFFFAEEKFLGKHFVLEETTMWLDSKAFMIEYFAYQTNGFAFGHTGGLARADFQ